jgi:hypothetical protein
MSNGSITLSPCVGFVECVTAHALKRWMERTGSKSRERALKSLIKQLERAEEVELAVQYRVAALLNHDLKPARYLKYDNWIFVVSLDGRVGDRSHRKREPLGIAKSHGPLPSLACHPSGLAPLRPRGPWPRRMMGRRRPTAFVGPIPRGLIPPPHQS